MTKRLLITLALAASLTACATTKSGSCSSPKSDCGKQKAKCCATKHR